MTTDESLGDLLSAASGHGFAAKTITQCTTLCLLKGTFRECSHGEQRRVRGARAKFSVCSKGLRRFIADIKDHFRGRFYIRLVACCPCAYLVRIPSVYSWMYRVSLASKLQCLSMLTVQNYKLGTTYLGGTMQHLSLIVSLSICLTTVASCSTDFSKPSVPSSSAAAESQADSAKNRNVFGLRADGHAEPIIPGVNDHLVVAPDRRRVKMVELQDAPNEWRRKPKTQRTVQAVGQKQFGSGIKWPYFANTARAMYAIQEVYPSTHTAPNLNMPAVASGKADWNLYAPTMTYSQNCPIEIVVRYQSSSSFTGTRRTLCFVSNSNLTAEADRWNTNIVMDSNFEYWYVNKNGSTWTVDVEIFRNAGNSNWYGAIYNRRNQNWEVWRTVGGTYVNSAEGWDIWELKPNADATSLPSGLPRISSQSLMTFNPDKNTWRYNDTYQDPTGSNNDGFQFPTYSPTPYSGAFNSLYYSWYVQ